MAPRWGQRGLQELSCAIYPLSGGPVWAHLGLSWALLGPSWGVQECILRQIWGLEGLISGCMVAKSLDVKNLKKHKRKINVFGRFPKAEQPSWAILGPSWAHLGAILGPSWSHLGAILGPSWGRLWVAGSIIVVVLAPQIGMRNPR